MGISRIEFYVGIFLVLGFIAYSHFTNNTAILDIKKAKIEVRDSVLLSNRDSALKVAGIYQNKSDSLQKVLDKHKLDDKAIQKKYDEQKKKVSRLDADSTISLFLRTTN